MSIPVQYKQTACYIYAYFCTIHTNRLIHVCLFLYNIYKPLVTFMSIPVLYNTNRLIQLSLFLFNINYTKSLLHLFLFLYNIYKPIVTFIFIPVQYIQTACYIYVYSCSIYTNRLLYLCLFLYNIIQTA